MPSASHRRAASRRALFIALFIIGTFFVIEITAGFLTNSLALLADAGHLLTDFAAILLALLALWFASRPITAARTFGYFRIEIFAALINGLTLWAIAAYIAYEAIQRIQNPPEVDSLPMLLVASAGFLAQTGTALVLHRASSESLNVRGAYIHVMTDAVQSVGVVIAGLLMLGFEWFLADTIISIVIALLITWSGGRVAWEAARILMESSPKHINLDALCARLERVKGVTGVHDIHAWSLTTG
ncbi:MAG: cation diffusion facilitator family transporter, partial [Dehalococcoidia bacterium]